MEGAEGAMEGEGEEEVPLEDVEHLQLTLPEAFFLCWALDCLTVLDPKYVRSFPTSQAVRMHEDTAYCVLRGAVHRHRHQCGVCMC